METVAEHRVQIAGHVTRALEVDGRRSRNRAPARLERLGGHVAAAARRARRRGRRAIAVDLPGFGEATPLQRGAVLPQLDTFATRARAGMGGRASRSSSRARRWAAAWRCGSPSSRASCGSSASSRWRRTGSSCRRGSTRSRRTRWCGACSRSRSPCRASCVRRGQANAYRQLALQHPSETQKAVVDAFSRDGETRADVAALLESGRALAPELSTAPFDLVGIRCPVLLVWGAHDRMLPHSDARMALDALPDHPGRADRGRRSAPAARRHPPPRRAAAAVRHVSRNRVRRLGPATLCRPCAGPCSLTIALLLVLVPAAGAAEPRIAARRQRRGDRCLGPDARRGRGRLCGANAPPRPPALHPRRGPQVPAVAEGRRLHATTSTSPRGARTTPA